MYYNRQPIHVCICINYISLIIDENLFSRFFTQFVCEAARAFLYITYRCRRNRSNTNDFKLISRKSEIHGYKILTQANKILLTIYVQSSIIIFRLTSKFQNISVPHKNPMKICCLKDIWTQLIKAMKSLITMNSCFQLTFIFNFLPKLLTTLSTFPSQNNSFKAVP